MHPGGTRANGFRLSPAHFSPHSDHQVDQVSRVCLAFFPALIFLLSLPHSVAQASTEDQHAPAQYAVSVQELRVPAKVRGYLYKAEQQFRKMRYAAAEKEIDRALRIDPACAAAFTMKALVEMASHDSTEALADATHATALDPNDSVALLALATAYNTREFFEQAEAAARQALKLRTDLWQAHLEMAKALYGQQQFVPALRVLDALKADFADIHLVRGDVLMQLGRSYEGAAEFAAFLDEAPHDPRGGQIKQIVASLAPAQPAKF